MTDLVEWLRAQLDDDERVALAAPRYNWTIYLAGDPEAGEETERRVLDHVIRHDPDRVLRQVEAFRLILDEHVHEHATGEPGFGCRTCAWQGSWEGVGADGWCRTVRLLALPYSDRPGYQESWRP